MAPPLHEAVAEVLLRLLDTRADLMVVVGSDPGPVGWVAQLRPDRFVAAPGPTSRLTVADGLRLAGCAVVTVLDAGIADLAQPASYGPAHVLLTELATHLGAAYRAGLTVMQPAWRTDVMHLATAALDGDGSVLLRVHGRALPPPRSGVDTAPGDGAQRVLHRGRAGLVLGAGATAPDAADVARMLAGRGVDVTALDAHTIRPGTGVDPQLTDAHLLVGPLDAQRAEALTPVRVVPGDARATMFSVTKVLEGLPRPEATRPPSR